jgi:hypothetical protein
VSKPKEFEAAASGVATKAELQRQIAAQPKPRAELHLTPDGYVVKEVAVEAFKKSQQRIKLLKERLDGAHDRLKSHRARAMVKGRAKQAFDRGR